MGFQKAAPENFAKCVFKHDIISEFGLFCVEPT